MNAYSDGVRSLVGEFESIAITLKPQNNIRYVDALIYLATAMEDDSPRKISLDSLKCSIISWIKRNLNYTLHYVRVFFVHEYKKNFTECQVVTRR